MSSNFTIAIYNTPEGKLDTFVFSNEGGKDAGQNASQALKGIDLRDYNLGGRIYTRPVDNILDVGILRVYVNGWIFSGRWRSKLTPPGGKIPRHKLPFHLAEHALSTMASDIGASRNDKPVEIDITVANQLIRIAKCSARGILLMDDFILEDVDTIIAIRDSLKLHELHVWLEECFNSGKYFTV